MTLQDINQFFITMGAWVLAHFSQGVALAVLVLQGYYIYLKIRKIKENKEDS